MVRRDLLEKRLPHRLARWAPQLIAAELCFGIDPYTLAAIIDRESLGGDYLTPKGPGGKGDGGHGHGLGQIDDRTHGPFLAARFDDGKRLWSDPTFNILYAARLTRRNMDAGGGDLAFAIAAYNCGARRAMWALTNRSKPGDGEAERIRALDSVTTGGDYVTDVLKRRSVFLPAEDPKEGV